MLFIFHEICSIYFLRTWTLILTKSCGWLIRVIYSFTLYVDLLFETWTYFYLTQNTYNQSNLWLVHIWKQWPGREKKHCILQSFLRSFHTSPQLQCGYINYISAASPRNITAFQVKMNLTSCDTRKCSNIAWVCNAAPQCNCSVVWMDLKLVILHIFPGIFLIKTLAIWLSHFIQAPVYSISKHYANKQKLHNFYSDI